MRRMTIGEVARRTGLKSSAIRYYEKSGLLPKPPRESGQRRYDPDVLQRLAIVRFTQHVGFKLREIRELLKGAPGRPPPERWRMMASAKANELRGLISRARKMRLAILQTLGHQCPHLVERGEELDGKSPRDELD